MKVKHLAQGHLCKVQGLRVSDAEGKTHSCPTGNQMEQNCP